MFNLKSKFWKILLVLLTFILIIFLIVANLFLPESSPETQKQEYLPPKGAGFNSLIPGQSTWPEAIETLGEPINDKGSATLDFESNNPNLPHQVVTENEKITFIREIVAPSDGKTTLDITNLYGNARYVLYGPESIHGFNLYIYPDKGIAYLGHLKEPVLLEIWYFQPTSFEEFRKKWATSYSDTPQVSQ